MSGKRVGILTLGCRVNLYESVAIEEALEAAGFEVRKDAEGCDLYIVNTCSVTAESHRQSAQAVRRCAAKGRTAVIGCASQHDASFFSSLPNVFYTGGCGDKAAVTAAVLREAERMDAGDPVLPRNIVSPMDGRAYEPLSVQGTGRLFSSCRAFVKIQDGCGAHCTYCLIPALRGPTRSRPLEEILEEVRRLSDAGYREIILTGISVSSYADRGRGLPDLIRGIGRTMWDGERGIARVRLGSLSPGSVTEEFLDAVRSSPNFMPHLHLSVQSGSDRILRLMGRPYTAEQTLEKIRLFREAVPGAELGADLITGFPTETEEDYRATEAFAEAAQLLHVHAFPYSEREGTAAASMEGAVPKEVRKDRCVRLNRLSDRLRTERLKKKIGSEVVLLAEKNTGGEHNLVTGHTEEYMECRVSAAPVSPGTLLRLRAAAVPEDGGYLEGETI